MESDPQVKVAVLAVDPSSAVSGGALLGDRTRVKFPVDEPRLYFRSQASDTDLGGVSRATFPVCRLLYRLFDIIFIETVGIGQSEIEIQAIADHVYLVMQPMAGDQIQFMKAGIMEIPDTIILNKCDEAQAARRSYHALRASLQFARPDAADRVGIVKTSAVTGLGLDDLAVSMLASRVEQTDDTALESKETHFFEKWVRDEYGRSGLRWLREQGGSAAYLATHGGYDAAQPALAEGFSAR